MLCRGLGRQVAEIAGDQIGHEDEVTCFAISSVADLGRLDYPVYGLGRAIAQGTVEAVEDAVR